MKKIFHNNDFYKKDFSPILKISAFLGAKLIKEHFINETKGKIIKNTKEVLKEL